MISAPAGGSNILSGIGVYTGGINPRAVGVLWRGCRFPGRRCALSGRPRQRHQSIQQRPHRRSRPAQALGRAVSQPLGDHGGGGSFADIWTPDTFAQAGFYVSDTKTPGHVYELSNEHHVRNEIKFDHVENWDINAPQSEEEAGESPESLSLEFDWSKNITVANYHGYRVTRSRAPFPQRFVSTIPRTFISAICMSMPRADMLSAMRMVAAHSCGSVNTLTRMQSRT